MKKLLLLLILIMPATASAQKSAAEREWNRPVEPFRLIGNIYYVGAANVSAYLIVTPQGHILTDGGFEETAPLILASIEKLGFKPRDVRVLLNSHAHTDHAGGLAALKKATGAPLYASAGDAPMLRSGGHGDFRFADSMTFAPVVPDSVITDRKVITLGGTKLTLQLTPGHTRGCTSWTVDVVEDGRKVPVLFTCSTSVLDYRFGENPSYPGIREDFEKTFARFKSLPCDVLLASHGVFMDLHGKRARMGEGRPNPFIDPGGCRTHFAAQEDNFRKALRR